ncbi:alpha/beta hydrolase [Aliikangiella sp. IMCC44359]|uniref:alpha/beta hydrolase n=1 Tax=Aliikangiella sp. IMCC44359 TaxID=3459125 RepID=UPI00403AE3E9
MTMWLVFGLLVLPWILCILFGFFLAYKLYHPYTKPRRKTAKNELNLKSYKIPSSSNVELDSIFLEAKGAKHLVLITHEIGSFKESKLKIAQRLISEGFSVLLFDLRNHGGSSRDRSLWPMSERFTDDIESALEFARKEFSQVETFSLYSFSFSTFPTLYIINRDMKQPCNIILDSGPSHQVEGLYGKFLDALGKELGMLPGFFKYKAFYPVVKFCFQFFGLRMLATTWPPDFSKIKSKVLFITNDSDPIFPESDILKVAESIEDKQVILYENSSHLQAYRVDPDHYENGLIQFLNQQTVKT